MRIIAYILLATVIGFLLGRFTVRTIVNPPTTQPTPIRDPNAALPVSLPPDTFLALKSEKGTQINVFRNEELSVITGIAVFNKSKNNLSVGFCAEDGSLSVLGFEVNGKQIRGWTFREDGSLETETIYEKGVKTYFKPDGSKDHDVKIAIHHG